jgi:adenine phosphoribosyltransferase
VSSFFNQKADFYENYLNHTDQKKIASKYISQMLEDTVHGDQIRVLCVGGGSGEGDLRVIKNLSGRKGRKFVIDYVDPSAIMYGKFLKRAREFGLDREIGKAYLKRFEDPSCRPEPQDVILVLNSLYFIKNWKTGAVNNPLEKIMGLMRPGGVAVLVVRSARSPHTILKKMAGGGRTTGDVLEKSLRKRNIPYYKEDVASSIDVTDCFSKGGTFLYNSASYKLLSFIFGDRWARLSDKRKRALVEKLKELSVTRNGRRYMKAVHQYFWIRKGDENAKKTTEMGKAAKDKRSSLGKKLRKSINSVRDFPVKGVLFRDTTPLLRDKKLFDEITDYAKMLYKEEGIDFCVAKDMQALIWAGAIASKLHCGVVPMFRKDLAGPVISSVYSHEYNPERLVHLQKNSIRRGQKVLMIDYIMATGETMRTMARMVEHLGGRVVGIFSIIELSKLQPRKGLENYRIDTIVKY